MANITEDILIRFKQVNKRAFNLELNADVEHEIWACWMQYLFTTGVSMPDGSYVLPPELVDRWKRQMQTPYDQLSEKEKDSDRDQVRKHERSWTLGFVNRGEGTGKGKQ